MLFCVSLRCTSTLVLFLCLWPKLRQKLCLSSTFSSWFHVWLVLDANNASGITGWRPESLLGVHGSGGGSGVWAVLSFVLVRTLFSSFFLSECVLSITISSHWSRKTDWRSVFKWPCVWPTSLVMSSWLYLMAVGSRELTGGTGCFSAQSSSVTQNNSQILMMCMRYKGRDAFLVGLSW